MADRGITYDILLRMRDPSRRRVRHHHPAADGHGLLLRAHGLDEPAGQALYQQVHDVCRHPLYVRLRTDEQLDA
mgnify:CR=1 FL=1